MNAYEKFKKAKVTNKIRNYGVRLELICCLTNLIEKTFLLKSRDIVLGFINVSLVSATSLDNAKYRFNPELACIYAPTS